jgi:hypothetical protein
MAIVLVSLKVKQDAYGYDAEATCKRCKHKATGSSEKLSRARKNAREALARTCPRKGKELNAYLIDELGDRCGITVTDGDGKTREGYMQNGYVYCCFGLPPQSAEIVIFYPHNARKPDEVPTAVRQLVTRLREDGYTRVSTRRVLDKAA